MSEANDVVLALDLLVVLGVIYAGHPQSLITEALVMLGCDQLAPDTICCEQIVIHTVEPSTRTHLQNGWRDWIEFNVMDWMDEWDGMIRLNWMGLDRPFRMVPPFCFRETTDAGCATPALGAPRF